MRRSRGLTALALLCTSATVGMCVYPTEHDSDVFVTIDSLTLDTVSRTPTSAGPLVLIRGDEGDVHATAWHRLSGGAATPLPNISFRWSVADTTLARIDVTTGHVAAIKPGTTQVRVVVTNFDQGASPATLDIRVAEQLAIDSIRPDTVKYGQVVTVYGVGLLDTLGVGLAIGDAGLIPIPFSDSTDSSGTSHVGYWVPPPAHSAPLFYIGGGVFGFTAESVHVIRRDLSEPNELSPTPINLETSRPFPGTVLNFLLFANPALAFEVLPRDVKFGADWYRFSQTTTRDLSIILSSAVPGTFQTFLTDSLGFRLSDTSYFIGGDAWTFGPSSHSCHGAAFGPKEALADSTVVALKGYPAGNLDAISLYAQPGRYALTVVEGYVTAKGFTQDAHEEDNYCNAVDNRVDTLAPQFLATLAIENPHDVDWFRINVPGSLARPVRFRTAAPSVTAIDTSDIDLYVLNIPAASDTVMTGVAFAAAGSAVDTTIILAPGDYYAVVVDFAGVPTRYTICVAVGGPNCAVLPAPMPTPSVTEVRAAQARRARLEAAIRERGGHVPVLQPGKMRR